MSRKGIYADILVKADYTFPRIFKNKEIITSINNLVGKSNSVLNDARHNYKQIEYDRKPMNLKGDVCDKAPLDEEVANEIYRRAITLHANAGTSNNGISSNHSKVFIPMDDPDCHVHENRLNMPEVKYTNTTRDYFIFEPIEEIDRKKYHGWVPGGAYIQSPEGEYSGADRISRQCFQNLVTNVHYPDGRELVPLHDRKDTWEDYEILSR